MKAFLSAALLLAGLQSWAAGTERRSLGRFELGAVGAVQGTGQNYTVGAAWNPTLFSVGQVGLDLLVEGILAKRTGGTYFAILSGGGIVHLDLGSRVRLSAGALYYYWSPTAETLLSPYAGFTFFWNKSALLQGVKTAYNYTDQSWGRAHIVRLSAVLVF